MFDFFENMRSKPLGKRRLAAFAVSLGITGVLFVVWLSVWFPNFTQTSNKKSSQQSTQESIQQSAQTDTVAQSADAFATPKDTFAESISGLWTHVIEQYNQFISTVQHVDLSASAQYASTSTAPTVSIIKVESATTTQATSSTSSRAR